MTTLYLRQQYSTVKLDGETLLVCLPKNQETGVTPPRKRLPLNKITGVIVFGDVTITAQAMSALTAQNAEICYLSAHGRFVSRVTGPEHKHSQLRLAQVRAHDDPSRSLYISVCCTRAKLHNQKTLLMRSNRAEGDISVAQAIRAIDDALIRIDALPTMAEKPPDLSRPQKDTVVGQLMGYEGYAAEAYFGVFAHLLNDPWGRMFTGRVKRPPTDPVNALLSFGYSLLTNQAVTAARVVGFDPFIGFYHSTQYGKPSLALDIIEMFRQPIVDSVVLTLLNNRILSLADFEESFGAWRLTEKGRLIFLEKFEDRLETAITHPVFKTKVTYRRCIEYQMRLLSRWLLGQYKRFREFHTR